MRFLSFFFIMFFGFLAFAHDVVYQHCHNPGYARIFPDSANSSPSYCKEIDGIHSSTSEHQEKIEKDESASVGEVVYYNLKEPDTTYYRIVSHDEQIIIAIITEETKIKCTSIADLTNRVFYETDDGYLTEDLRGAPSNTFPTIDECEDYMSKAGYEIAD